MAVRVRESQEVADFFADPLNTSPTFRSVLFSKDPFPCIYLAGTGAEEAVADYQFAKWAEFFSFHVAVGWLLLKGGGQGTPGATFRPFSDGPSIGPSDAPSQSAPDMRRTSLSESGADRSSSTPGPSYSGFLNQSIASRARRSAVGHSSVPPTPPIPSSISSVSTLSSSEINSVPAATHIRNDNLCEYVYFAWNRRADMSFSERQCDIHQDTPLGRVPGTHRAVERYAEVSTSRSSPEPG
ncbi:hypothetical protein EIP86_005773 [Pleurotus ostreatoroseus]|nr:hypothetical protein EIP86_005773 [Pleurotus ostreatoroseus]